MTTPFDLPLSGSPKRKFYGTAEADSITGTSGNDYISGGAGVDTMRGGAGDDVYVVDSSKGDTVVESAGQGIDTVISWASKYTLAANVENFEMRGTYASWTYGNGLNNLMRGSDAQNYINGGGGRDILIGGKGADKLTGGSGGDMFVYELASDAGDTITDFKQGEDLLDFRKLMSQASNRIEVNSSAAGTDIIVNGTRMATLSGVAANSLDFARDMATAGSFIVSVDGRQVSPEVGGREATASTSDKRPPFSSDIWITSNGADQGLSPQHLFWEKVSAYSDPAKIAQTRQIAAANEASGHVAVIGMQGWVPLFAQSMPGGKYANLQGHQAWVAWVTARADYLGVNHWGRVHEATASNPFGWGYVSPLMPLRPEDVPAGFNGTQAYYADWMADKLGRLAAHTGTRGFNLSDFYDSHPYSGPEEYFNLRIIADFSRVTGISVAGNTVVEKAAVIQAKYTQEYLDYFVDRWSYGWKALADSIERHTGKDAWLTTQVALPPAAMRELGAVDVRILGDKMDLGKLLLNVQTLERFVMQHKEAPASYESAMIGLHAARAPDGHYGHMITSDESQYWDAVRALYTKIDGAARDELGIGRLKQTWFGSAWTHIAEDDGGVRRASEVWQRSYHDVGTVDQSWVDVLRDVVPTRPFGPALYYSVNAERAMNVLEPIGNVVGNAYLGEMLQPVTKLYDAGVPFGYYVSDVALESITPQNAPSQWIIPQRYYNGKDLFTEVEISALRATAPVLVADEALTYDFPLKFLENDPDAQMTGFAFYDQRDRLVVVASDRVDFNDTAARSSVDVRIQLELPSGHYHAENLLDHSTAEFDAVNGVGGFNVDIARWDTVAFAITGNYLL